MSFSDYFFAVFFVFFRTGRPEFRTDLDGLLSERSKKMQKAINDMQLLKNK